MIKELTKKHKITVFMLGFAGQLCWAIENQQFNLFMYNEISPTPLYVSLMVAFSAIASTLTAIFIGALSDAKGKRKVFFIIGFSFSRMIELSSDFITGSTRTLSAILFFLQKN